MFEALAGVNSQGGAFPRKDTVELLDSVSKKASPEIIYKTLKKVHDTLPNQNERDVTLAVFGGRYFNWQRFSWECKISYACQSWLPQKIKFIDKVFIKNISDNNYFKAIYVDPENVIFELR